MFFLNLIICYLCSKYLLDNIGWMFIFISIVSCLLSLFRYRYPVFLFFVIISGFLTYDYPVNFIFIAMLIFIFKLEGDYREYLVNILSGVFSIIFVLVFFGGEGICGAFYNYNIIPLGCVQYDLSEKKIFLCNFSSIAYLMVYRWSVYSILVKKTFFDLGGEI